MRIHSYFYEQAQKYPDRVVLSEQHNSWTYKELAQCVSNRASALMQDGAIPGHIFIIKLENCMEWIQDALAVSKIGGIIMPVHPDVTEIEWQTIISSTEPNWIITSKETLCQTMEPNTIPFPLRHVSSKDELYFFGYTSGSTGTPKGFVKSHQSWTSSFEGWSKAFSLIESDRVVVPLHLSYSAQLYPALQALAIGSEIVLLSKFTPEAFLKAKGSCASITPALIEPLIRHAKQKRSVQEMIPRCMISVGTKLSPIQRQKFEECFPKSFLYEYYGSSEMGYASLLTPEDARTAPETVGIPFPDVEIAFFNEKKERIVINKENFGKLFVRSGQAFEGYIENEKQTKATFIEDWVTSHDIGFQREDGKIVLVGRDRDVIKAAGSFVYAGEIEDVLLGITGVIEAGVFSEKDENRGEIIRAVIVKEVSRELVDIQKECRQKLIAYKQPRNWTVLSRLPKKPNGKVDKMKLRAELLSNKLYNM
ncbi:class I adenylate-forming enzyme family protein [Bacillus pseudomycoides]|uniref:class I adenylate-forming enzyme family protein n=1 Tax=Bacillus pseudomycoides TaxID=64104 RepID=UPI000BF58F11|nr:class I adenylate-forming enzyme family protein [Bacillus pseudomycoides]PGD92547.1 AMP-dependent synthetase [Bacillus pseudomycoides]PHE69434.1 AMP-dependent synthetase [Bacillus pseudomycoides]